MIPVLTKLYCAGILVAGVCVFAGSGTYNFELELMDQTGPADMDPVAAAAGEL